MAAASGGAPRRLRLPVPVTVVTGGLGSGKTTAIASLLRCKPADEVWAVLVNEFGAAGLDAALLEGGATPLAARPGAAAAEAGGATPAAAAPPLEPAAAAAAPSSGLDGVHIKQLAGGCLCCALSNVTSLAIAQLLRSVKPDRLIIEPSGLAHPAALLQMLQGEHLGRSLALQPVACLVDATQFAGGAAEPPLMATQLLADQVAVADVLIGSKADLCDEVALQAFAAWAAELFPPKSLVATAQRGQLDAEVAAALLGAPQGDGNSGASAAGGQAVGAAAAAEPGAAAQSGELPLQRPRRGAAGVPWLSSSQAAADEEPEPGRPLRRAVLGADGAHAACGWIFHRGCLFSRARLLELLPQLAACTLRLKGVFRVGQKTWVAASAGAGGAAGQVLAAAAAAALPRVELIETAYQRDSRAEVIVDVSAASSSLELQAAGLSLGGGGGMQQQVAAAVRQAAGGDWTAVEALLLEAQDPSNVAV